jgi:hypothetical protein
VLAGATDADQSAGIKIILIGMIVTCSGHVYVTLALMQWSKAF